MGDLALSALKLFLLVFSSTGIVFHLLALKNPERGIKMEQKLGTELGVKKRFIPWLEKDRMQLHERLIRNKTYNSFAIICLAALVIALSQL